MMSEEDRTVGSALGVNASLAHSRYSCWICFAKSSPSLLQRQASSSERAVQDSVCF